MGSGRVKYQSFTVFAVVLFITFAACTKPKAGAVPNPADQSSDRRHQTENLTMVQEETIDVEKGVWGGKDVVMTVEDDRVTIEFVCADGSIRGRLRTDRSGRFRAEGTFRRYLPGPQREDAIPDPWPVFYSGEAAGKKIDLNVTRRDTDESIGTFSLEHGKSVRLNRCL